MAFNSFAFPAFALLAIAILRLCPLGLGRNVALCILNIVFLASFVKTPEEAIPLLAFVAFGYLAILAVSAARKAAAIGFFIFSIVAMFVWLKQYTIVAPIPRLHFAYMTVGLSYILFRILHLLIDVAQGVVKVPSVLGYFNYTTFFLTLVSGPIALYHNFSSQMKQPVVPMTREALDRSLRRVLLGFLGLFALAAPLAMIGARLQAALYVRYDEHAWLAFIVIFAAAAGVYLVYLYINFVAYMDIVIGIGELAGFSLPENFDKPYNSANFLDLWNRWHITLSQWFKIYLFNPLLKTLAAHWGRGAAAHYLGATAFFFTFGVMGVWHGTTWVFIIYGLILGLGATVNKLWQVGFVNFFGKKYYRALCGRAWYQHLSRSFTLAFFAIALTCLWIDPARTGIFAELSTSLCSLGALLTLTLIGSIAATAQKFYGDGGGGLIARFVARSFDVVAANRLTGSYRSNVMAWNIAMIFLVLALSVVTNGLTVEIVYKGF